MSLFGSVTIRFAYYHCRHCGEGSQPWCDKLRLSNEALTPAADEITALACVLGSFVDGAQRVLWKMAGLRLSESTVERTTEAAGQRVRQQLGEGKSLGPTSGGAWQLEEMDLGTSSVAIRKEHRQAVQYFHNHEHRMDYPTYVRNGWQIGSGSVESACKTAVGNRLKNGGMRWGEDDADAVCHLRALYLSESAYWESF